MKYMVRTAHLGPPRFSSGAAALPALRRVHDVRAALLAALVRTHAPRRVTVRGVREDLDRELAERQLLERHALQVVPAPVDHALAVHVDADARDAVAVPCVEPEAELAPVDAAVRRTAVRDLRPRAGPLARR